MKEKYIFFFLAVFVVVSGVVFVRMAVIAATLATPTAQVTVTNAPPTVSAVAVNPTTITLSSYPTTNVSVNATIADNNGCTDITGGTTTILLYRSGVGSSSCLSGTGSAVTNLNCYVATAFTASSSCSGGSTNTTTTFGVYYFAQATDASSSFPSQNWKATVVFKDPSNATGTADDGTNPELNTLLAISISTSSLNYGSIPAGSDTSSTNQGTSINNQGNSTTTIQVAGQSLLTAVTSLAVGSQRFNTTPFTFPGASTALPASSSPATVVTLTAPTSTASSSYTQATYWGLQVASGTAQGVYNGSNIFSGIFTP